MKMYAAQWRLPSCDGNFNIILFVKNLILLTKCYLGMLRALDIPNIK